MDGLYRFLSQTFGPMVQIAFFLFLFFLAAWCICSLAFWGQRKLIQIGHPILWISPVPLLIAGLLYGSLRFSGQLIYPADGWAQWGPWHYTNQNYGASVLLICGCLLIGAALAIYKEKVLIKAAR